MDRVQVRGRVGFKIILSEVLGMLRIVPFLPQRRSFYAAALQTSVAPLSPRRGATEGNRQGRNTGAPQKDYTQHCLPWDRRLDLSGYSRTHQMRPTHWPQPRLTLTLTPRQRGPPDSPRSKVNTAATHQTRFKSPVSMLNGKSS